MLTTKNIGDIIIVIGALQGTDLKKGTDEHDYHPKYVRKSRKSYPSGY